MNPESTCSGCHKPPPLFYCWENRDFDCPLEYPPCWTQESTAAAVLWKEVCHLRGVIQTLLGEPVNPYTD